MHAGLRRRQALLFDAGQLMVNGALVRLRRHHEAGDFETATGLPLLRLPALVAGALVVGWAVGRAGFARLGLAEPRTEEIATSYSAGLVLSGRLLGFEDEALGLGVTSVRTGAPYRRAQAALRARVGRHETAVELTYRAQGRDFRLTDVFGKVVTPILA